MSPTDIVLIRLFLQRWDAIKRKEKAMQNIVLTEEQKQNFKPRPAEWRKVVYWLDAGRRCGKTAAAKEWLKQQNSKK